MAALLLVSSGGTHSGREGGTFRVGILGEFFTSVDPVLGGKFVGHRATCGGLMTTPDKPLPAGLRVVPEIATDYPKVTNRGRTYTFTIRQGVRFSTGAPVTARSFAHTINRILHPTMKSPFASSFEEVVGAHDVMEAKAATASGIVASGNTLTVRLMRPAGDFLTRLLELCVVPENTPIDPEGAKAPVPGAGPYYVAEYNAGRRVVLERNRFYLGTRPRHVDRFVIDLTSPRETILDRVERGELDYALVPPQDFADRAEVLRRKYGVNRSRFFVMPANNLRMFVLNTQGPLFGNNVKLRQAVNFAVDRKALLRERGPLAGYLTDQYLPPRLPGFRNEHIYPLKAPDIAKARALARGNLRGGHAVLYVPSQPLGIAQGEIVRQNLKRVGLDVEIKQFPGPVLFQKLASRGEPFDIGWIGWNDISPDGSLLNFLFDGLKIGQSGYGNYSYFDSRQYNRRLEAASRLPIGPDRNRAYGELDVDIAKNAAPAIAYAYDNTFTLVSQRTGCVVVKPELDLAAVCLK